VPLVAAILRVAPPERYPPHSTVFVASAFFPQGHTPKPFYNRAQQRPTNYGIYSSGCFGMAGGVRRAQELAH
jgi:hypothetical protein